MGNEWEVCTSDKFVFLNTDRVTQEHFYSGAAMNALSYADKMPAGTRDVMKKSFGSSTVVTLSNGATLDTRPLG